MVEGIIYLWVAKGFYLLSGYMIHVFLGRFLGLGDYGVFGTVLATASIFDLVVNTGVPQAVSRYLGVRGSDVRAVFKTGFRCQLTVCTVLSLSFFVCAKLLANGVLNDHSLTPYLQLLALSFLPVGLLRLYTSALLGVHEYFKASVLYTVESFFRLCLVVILVLMGWRVFGAIWGYVFAALLPLVWAYWSYKFKKTERKQPIDARTLLAFSLPLIMFAGFSSLFLNVGTLMVKGLIGEDRAVGLYVAASVLANAPYHLFGSVRSVLMPALSYADGGESVELIKKYIGKGLRLMVFFLVPVIVLISLNAERLISAFYGNAFSGAGMALEILVVGTGTLALGSTFCVLFDAKGHPWVSVAFLGISLAVSIAGNFILIPWAGILGAATAVLIAGTVLCFLSGGYVFLRYGPCLPYLSLGRIVLAGILSYGGGFYAMNRSLGLLWSDLLVGSIYVCALFMSGELKQYNPMMRKLLSPFLGHSGSENPVE